jgi:hypothetical protein
MAKKKSAGRGGNGRKRERGMPQKQCPQCQSMQHARKAKCANCGFEFPIKAARRKKRGRVKATNGEQRAAARAARDSERLAMEYVLFAQQGDIAKAIQAVEGFEHSRLVDFIDQAGGKARAVSVLTKLQERARS